MLRTANGAEKPDNKTAADIASDWSDRAESDLLEVFGIKKDEFGVYSQGTGTISRGEAKIITGQVERDINMVVNNLMETNPGLANDPIRLQAAIGQELKNWYKENFLEKGGKYYIGDFKSQQTGEFQEATAEQLRRFRDLSNSPGVLSRPDTSPQSFSAPQNLIGIRQSPGGFSPAIARNFNPLRGDRVFTRAEVETLQQSFEEGDVQSTLSTTAQQLGMTPAALLQQQMNSYGLGVLQAPVDTRQGGGTGDTQTNMVDGARQLMSVGFPRNGAAYLAGTIQAESSWRLRRPTWGEVKGDGSDRNGGAISWMDDAERNHYRLRDIERYLGKPIEQASNIEQLKAIRWELETKYEPQFRILMNPYSTPRQLRRAIKRYIGYNPRYVGARFTDAEQILRVL